QQQRVRHVVAVANVGEMKFLEISKMFLQGKEVGKSLARMLELAESVDHRNVGVSCHLFDDRMAEGSQDDDVDPAIEVVGDVVKRLARIEAAGRLVDEECAAAQAVHAGFEREAGAQGGLLEEHNHLLAGENAAEVRRTQLEHG